MKPFVLGSLACIAVLTLTSLRPTAVDGKLDDAMQILQGNMKRAEKAFESKDAAKLLPAILEMQAAAQTAKTLVPPKAAELTDAKKQDEMVKGFRAQMIELQKGLLDVEAAAVQGKIDDAKKAFDEKVKPAKKTGHDTYKDED